MEPWCTISGKQGMDRFLEDTRLLLVSLFNKYKELFRKELICTQGLGRLESVRILLIALELSFL